MLKICVIDFTTLDLIEGMIMENIELKEGNLRL